MTHAPDRVRREDPRRTPSPSAGKTGTPGHRSTGKRTLIRLLLVTFVGLGIAVLTPGVASADGEQVRGTLTTNTTGPIEGVTVTVETADGQEVGEAESDERGRFSVPVPAAGEYVVTLDADSLPEGVTVGGGGDTRTVTVEVNGREPVNFALSSGERGGGSERILAVQLFVDGLRFGLLIAICAVGLSLIFGTTGLTNFAHGEMVTIGAIVAFYLNVDADIPLLASAVLAVIIGGLIGALNELALWRPLRRRGTGLVAALVVSIGLSLAVRYIIQTVYGGRSNPYTDYQSQRARDYGTFALTDRDLYSIIISLVVLLAVALMLQRTRIGKAMRAVADNRDLAASSGINVDRVILVVWVMGGALAALGGVLLGLSDQIQWDMGFRLLLLMFAGVTLGGLGTAYGALIGSVIVGVFVQMSTLVIRDDMKYVGGLLLLILILIVRPQGILGSKARIG
ncbi:branched-chain amino acid ABC transporter permease [Blastococcus sp. URHD0036]|uniref:branched-chain amino acid ABC transporter permease n=1 Tax=Blastococcus sp. URHD0036 TaxID=1380356 RepID=UPI000AD41D3D|nr:branched-chain amino acid ABC transporter permease [Blastococcus sp. URHD0036]